jgi:hypothetical protein
MWGVVTDYTDGNRITTTVGFGCRRPIIWGMKRRIADNKGKVLAEGAQVVGFDPDNPLKGLPPAEVMVAWTASYGATKTTADKDLVGRVCQKVWYVVESMLFNKFEHPIFFEPVRIEAGSTVYIPYTIWLRSPYQAHILMPIILHLLYGVVNKLRLLSEAQLKEIDSLISDVNGDIKQYYKALCDKPIWNHDPHQTKTRDALIEKGISAFWPAVKDKKNLLRDIWAEYGCVTTVDTFYHEKVAKKPYPRGWIEGEWRENIQKIPVVKVSK